MANINDIYLGVSPNDGTGDELRTGGQIINDNFAYVDSMLNNKAKAVLILGNTNEQPYESAVNAINTYGLIVEKDEIPVIRVSILYSNGLGVYRTKVYTYLWGRGAGAFGTVNANTVNNLDFIFVAYNTGQDTKVYSLGEIGTTPIEDAVNVSGPYIVFPSQTTIFSITRNGSPESYLYVGDVTGKIGLGENQTSDIDYVQISGNNVNPIDDSDLVYGNAKVKDAPIASASGLTSDYVVVNDSGTHYFGVKKSLNIEFEQTKLLFLADDSKHEIGAPTTSNTNYNFWNIGTIANLPADGMDTAFDVWFINKLVTVPDWSGDLTTGLNF